MRRTNRIWCWALVLSLAFFAAQGKTIKMMSFNIRMGCGLSDPFQLDEGSLGYLPQCAEVIKAAAPDWVAIQEIDRNTDRAGHVDQTAELARLCGMKGTFVSKITKPGGEYGLALLSKEEPISVSKVLMPGSSHTRAVLIAEFADYVVACTHFPLTAEKRLNAARIVKETFANYAKPVFLAGDLNAAPSEESITLLAEQFEILTDTSKPTFRADNPTTCIDYIMVDKGHAAGVTVKDRQVIAAPQATDHCALTVTADVDFPIAAPPKSGAVAASTLLDASVGNVSTQNCLYGGAVLTDFQVPVYLKEGKNGFSYAGYAADGSDLRVTDISTGVLLPYEIETWNTSATSVVWVKVPTFSPATKLQFSGGDASAPQATGQGDSIWTNAYKVFHFGDSLAKDSSPFGTIMTVSETDTEESPIVRGFHGGTANKRLSASGLPPADMGQMGNTFSVSFWMKLDSLTQPSCYLFQGRGPGQWAVVYNYLSGHLGFFAYDATTPNIGSMDKKFAIPVSDLEWHHYAFTYNGSTFRIYCDGVEVQTQNTTFNFLTRTASNGEFFLMGNAGDTRLQGTLDEFRVESVARSADWIKAIYRTSHPEEIHLAGGLYDGNETLPDFILPVSFRANRGGFTTAQQIRMKADRSCFRFVNELDEELEYETELLAQESEVNSVFWVKVPKFTKDTVVKLRLMDGGQPSDTYVSTGNTNSNLWDESYMHVWHLADTARRWDSTASAMNLSPEGSQHSWINNPAAADGPTGRYLAMQTGTNSSAFAAARSSALCSLRKQYTFSFWARKEDLDTHKESYVWQFYVGSTQFAIVAGYYSQDRNCFSFFNGATQKGIHVPDSEWHHYALVSDGTNVTGYLDGESVGILHPSFDFGQDAGAAEKAHRVGLSGGLAKGLPGAMDEFRIENVARSAAWIKALYQTQQIFRKGVARLPSPIFGVGDAATCLSSSAVRFEADLVCQQPSGVWLCYGPADGGQSAAAWANALPLGELPEGTIATNLTGLAADTGISARFFASNAYGTAWSPLLQARTGTECGVKAAKIAVTGYDGTETLEGFPLCAVFDASFGLPETAAEVRFLTEDGIALPYEVEEWNPAGESVVWIRVPELRADTTLYATWGRAFNGTTTSWDKTAVWGPGYNFVWHLSALTDSSRIGANLSGGSSYVTATNGVVGQGRYLVKKTDGDATASLAASNYEPKDIGGAFTYSYWAKMDALTGQQYLLNTIYAYNGRISMIYGFSGNTMEIYLQPSSALDWSRSASTEREYFRSISQIPVTDSEWHHYAWSYDGRTLRSYQDGVLVKSGMANASLGQPFPGYALHQSTAFGGGSGMTGAMDEIRLESVEHSADWIRACYLNQTGQLCTLTPPISKGTLLFIL